MERYLRYQAPHIRPPISRPPYQTPHIRPPYQTPHIKPPIASPLQYQDPISCHPFQYETEQGLERYLRYQAPHIKPPISDPPYQAPHDRPPISSPPVQTPHIKPPIASPLQYQDPISGHPFQYGNRRPTISGPDLRYLVSYAAVLYLVTQRSSPRTAAENQTTFLSLCFFGLSNKPITHHFTKMASLFAGKTTCFSVSSQAHPCY